MTVLPLILAAAQGVAQSPSAAPASEPVIPTGPELRAEIHALDAEFFRIMWKDCDNPEQLAAFIHPQVEFYHDRNGARSDPTVTPRSARRRCDDEARTGRRHRRELDEASFHVDPIPRFGALATGTHRFYRQEKGQPEKLLSTARFAILLKREADGWKHYRIFSYDHRSPADSPSAAAPAGRARDR